MSWENTIQTILGAAVSRLLEKWRGEGKERRMKHFKEISKKSVLSHFSESLMT
jgi:hypothetical protein